MWISQTAFQKTLFIFLQGWRWWWCFGRSCCIIALLWMKFHPVIKFFTGWLWRQKSWQRMFSSSFSFGTDTPSLLFHSWWCSCHCLWRTSFLFSGRTWSSQTAWLASPSLRSPLPHYHCHSKKAGGSKKSAGLRVVTETAETYSLCSVALLPYCRVALISTGPKSVSLVLFGVVEYTEGTPCTLLAGMGCLIQLMKSHCIPGCSKPSDW